MDETNSLNSPGPKGPELQVAEASDVPAPSPDTCECSPDDSASSAEASGSDDLEQRLVEALKTVYDPEIPVDIYELGLIYDVRVANAGDVGVKMTLTSPACPVAGSLPGDVQRRLEAVDGVTSVEVELVWDPAWNPSMMSEAARLELGFF